MYGEMAANLIYVGLAALYFYEVSHVWKVNKIVFKEPVPELHQYKF